MALTRIRGSQIQDATIGNAHIDPSNPIVYSKLDLSSSVVASDLSTNHTVHTDVLDYKLVALWDLVQNVSVSGTSTQVTSQVQAAAVVDTATVDGSAKGILTTGTGLNGVGIENYKVQVRNASTKDNIEDGLGGTVYAELLYEASQYNLYFKKSDGTSFTMAAHETATIGVDANTDDVLRGKWFLIASPTTKYRIVFAHDGDAALAALAGYTDVQAIITATDDAAAVATAIRTALNGISGGAVFTATGSAANVSISTVSGSVIHAISDGAGTNETDFAFATTGKGSPASVDFMIVEIYSLNSAPLKGFVTGTGFADVVSITGSHNHNDLYYSKSDLEAGQLDDRYFTQSELTSGQLDSRYYTESELTNGSLDSRYYTESELGSTVVGSSGASKIGVAGITNLAAGDIQGALAELQGDIDDIVDGTITPDISLDDAYNHGSDVVVDTSNVTWTLSGGRSVIIADANDSSKLSVTNSTSADSVKIDTSGGVDIDTHYGFSLTDGTSASMFSEITGVNSAVNISAGSVTNSGSIDIGAIGTGGTKNSELTMDGLGNINLSGNSVITLDSETTLNLQAYGTVDIHAENVVLKDRNLTASIPLSQTGVTGLSANLTATSIIGAINENANDLNTLIATTLPATTDGSSGADGIGVTGITGVTPTGGTSGGNGTVQSMLEGVALSAGGGKTFATVAAFTTAKSGGTYFKLNELVFILDINRWVKVLTQSTGITELTDWILVESVSSSKKGQFWYQDSSSDYFVESKDFTASAHGTMSITDAATTSGLVIHADSSVDLSSTSSVDITGAIALTNTVDTNLAVTTSGTGEVQITSADEIDLNAPTIDVHGDMNMPDTSWLSVGNIKISSVDPTDFATISGERTGAVSTLNMLSDPGFENGGSTWTLYDDGYSIATIVTSEHYYDTHSLHFVSGVGDHAFATQIVSGILPNTTYTVSFNVKGNFTNVLGTKVGGTWSTNYIQSGTYSEWTRVSSTLTTGASVDNTFELYSYPGSDIDFYVDAVMLEAGSSATNYFNDYKSSLIFTIGDNDDDQIVFRSVGTATSDLMRINQSTVEILGNLNVTGTTTTVNSQDLLVADNQIVLNSNVTGEPLLDAYFKVERGTSDDVAIRWNESSDAWELTNDGIDYLQIVTSGGGGTGLSLDSAYDGGSTVTVDNTSVSFILSATKSFMVTDATDTAKVVITAGNSASSVKIDTSGGVDIDTDAGFTINDDSGAHLQINSSGQIDLGTTSSSNRFYADSGSIELFSNSGYVKIDSVSNSEADSIHITSAAGGIDINAAATKPITLDSGSFSIDGVLASNVSTTGAALTVSTLTSGNLNLTSAGELVFSDSRLSGIEFTDASNATLPGSTTSIVGAINAAWNAAQGANTLDEVYDGETGTRVVTMDNGSIGFDISDSYVFSLRDSTATAILEVQALAAGDVVDVNAALDVDGITADFNLTGTGASSFKVDTTGGVDIDTDVGFALNDDSGASFVVTAAGAVNMASASTQVIGITASGALNLTSSTGNVTVTSNATSADSIKLTTSGGVQVFAGTNSAIDLTTTGTGAVNIASSQEIDLSGGAIDINGGSNSNITIDAVGTGEIQITTADSFKVAGAAVSEIVTSAGNLTVHATGTGADLKLGDGRTGDITWSDATHTSLPGGATSLMAAITAAYDHTGSSVSKAYHEVTASSTDVSNDYVVTNITLFPTTGTFPMSPSALRALSDQVHAIVYLNGLRLSDTEWRYSYNEGTSERRISFDGSNNITLVTGDIIMIDVEKVTA